MNYLKMKRLFSLVSIVFFAFFLELCVTMTLWTFGVMLDKHFTIPRPFSCIALLLAFGVSWVFVKAFNDIYRESVHGHKEDTYIQNDMRIQNEMRENGTVRIDTNFDPDPSILRVQEIEEEEAKEAAKKSKNGKG